MPSSTIHSALALTALLLTTPRASAQLLGCSAVGCPVESYRNARCEIGNATLKAVGIANLTTSLDPRPLTWTLGLDELEDNGTSTQIDFDRNLYLGTPPSLQLNDTKGCALFFEGVARNLTVPSALPVEDFSCKSVLAEQCLSDLVAQAQENYRSLVAKGEKGDAALCGQLRDSLVNQPPGTCKNVTGPWGAVSAEALTNPTTPPLSPSSCHPTTGQNYTLSLISSSRHSATNRSISEFDPILNAVTPVMTVFGKGDMTEAEVQLSCLKLVESQEGRAVDTPTEGRAPVVRSGLGVWVGMVVMTWAWFVIV